MVTFTPDDLKTPEQLERVLRQFERALFDIVRGETSGEVIGLARQLAPLIRNELQATGSAPLNLEQLLPGAFNPQAHQSRHQVDGADEIGNILGLAHLGANGSAFSWQTATELLSTAAGASVSTTGLIPVGAYEVGVVTRVTTTITGATTFDIGDGTDVDAWGAGVLLPAGTTSTSADWTVGPLLMEGGGDVTLTANGANFTGGAVRVVAFYKIATGPTS